MVFIMAFKIDKNTINLGIVLGNNSVYVPVVTHLYRAKMQAAERTKTAIKTNHFSTKIIQFFYSLAALFERIKNAISSPLKRRIQQLTPLLQDPTAEDVQLAKDLKKALEQTSHLKLLFSQNQSTKESSSCDDSYSISSLDQSTIERSSCDDCSSQDLNDGVILTEEDGTDFPEDGLVLAMEAFGKERKAFITEQLSLFLNTLNVDENDTGRVAQLCKEFLLEKLQTLHPDAIKKLDNLRNAFASDPDIQRIFSLVKPRLDNSTPECYHHQSKHLLKEIQTVWARLS